MKIKKITCFLQADIKGKEKDLRRTIIRSGYKGSYLVVEEDSCYNLGIAYLSPEQVKEFLIAKKGL